MTQLPASPDLVHLKKQAKQLLREARGGEPQAVSRFIATLPLIRAAGLAALATHELKLYDAQSVIAREYGFLSWTEMKRFVEWEHTDGAERARRWFEWVYEGGARERRLALRELRARPGFGGRDVWVACATGDEGVLRDALAEDATWVNRAGGPLGMPPLVAVTHSLLMLEEGFEAGLLACAGLLLGHGAEVNGWWVNPRSGESPLSALYGAAGRTHSAAMTRLLLDAGANPDDGESLYHSVESRDGTCLRLLLKAGARVSGTNAIGRVLDYGRLEDLELLLEHGGDARERPWIHHAILRGRSTEHVRVLVDAGADLRAVNREGVSVGRWARMHGRADVVEMLREAEVTEALTLEEEFVAACSEGDTEAARAIEARVPGIMGRLSAVELRALPELADTGDLRGVRTMLEMGWPREVKAAWKATALHLALYRGDAAMTELLLAHGADWRTEHGYGGNAVGALAYGSTNDVEDPAAPREYVGCARRLIEHGMPLPDQERYIFSAEVAAYFNTVRLEARTTEGGAVI